MFKGIKNYLKVGDKQWTVRRRLVMLLNAFCIVNIVAGGLGYYNIEPKIIIEQSFSLMMAINLYYIAGVVADDVMRKRPVQPRANEGRRYREEEEEDEENDEPDRGPRPHGNR